MKKDKLRLQKGFTFIELLLYVTIVTIIMSSLVPFAWNIIGGSVKSNTEQEVYAHARFVSEKIKYEIRNSDGIQAGASIFNTHPGKLVLAKSGNPDTVIDVLSGKVRISQNGGAYVNLNSNDTTVTNLVFTNYSSADLKTEHVSFALTISYINPGTRHEYDETLSITSSAEVRTN